MLLHALRNVHDCERAINRCATSHAHVHPSTHARAHRGSRVAALREAQPHHLINIATLWVISETRAGRGLERE
eukprot:6210584-Pleurochrysis_carterae.AAC.2